MHASNAAMKPRAAGMAPSVSGTTSCRAPQARPPRGRWLSIAARPKGKGIACREFSNRGNRRRSSSTTRVFCLTERDWKWIIWRLVSYMFLWQSRTYREQCKYPLWGQALTIYEKTKPPKQVGFGNLRGITISGRINMMRLLVEEVGKGLHPSEVVVAIKAADRMERLVVSRRSIKNGSIQVGWPLGEKDDLILIELPRETQTGAWRVWISRKQLIEEERMRA